MSQERQRNWVEELKKKPEKLKTRPQEKPNKLAKRPLRKAESSKKVPAKPGKPPSKRLLIPVKLSKSKVHK
jgi:hypothetical protein